MSEIVREFENFIKENSLISKGESVLAAVSGGADSMCMLSLLADYCQKENVRLGVVHVNHGFRPEAVDEATYVQRFCEEREITFFLREIEPGSCRNSEEEARINRYALMEEVVTSNGFTKLALAHNAQDRAETMLFNMFRGTGLTGLIGIRPKRVRNEKKYEIIRPILFLNRDKIEKFLDEKGISYCTDSSNLEDNYNRNKIRHHIIPVAKEINSMSITHMSQVSDRLIQIEEYIQKQSQRAFDKICDLSGDEIILNLQEFNKLDPVIRVEVLRKSIIDMTPHLKDITAEHIECIDRLSAKTDNGQLSLPYGIVAIKEYDKLIFTHETSTTEERKLKTVILNKEGETKDIGCTVGSGIYDIYEGRKLQIRIFEKASLSGEIKELIPRNKYTKWFDYDKIDQSLEVRYKAENDVISIDCEGHTKSLNRIMIDSKIPSRHRNQIPVVAKGSDVLWLIGYRDSAGYRVHEGTKTILEIRVLEEKENG